MINSIKAVQEYPKPEVPPKIEDGIKNTQEKVQEYNLDKDIPSHGNEGSEAVQAVKALQNLNEYKSVDKTKETEISLEKFNEANKNVNIKNKVQTYKDFLV